MADQSIRLNMVGSSKFGRYAKISVEKTFNFIISDGFLVPYAGSKSIFSIPTNEKSEGRGIYSSTRGNFMVAVIDDSIYIVSSSLGVSKIGNLNSGTGNVSIDENNANQIAICDGTDIWIYNYVTSLLSKASIDFLPGYICFQNGRFVAVDLVNAKFRLSDINNGLSWPVINTGLFQTKPDKLQGVVRVPGKGNLLYIFGTTVVESWYDAGAQLFPLQKSTFSNIDYGALNGSSIATLENHVAWIGGNEKSGPSLMISQGGDVKRISTDGIDFLLANLKNPSNCFGFMFRQDGHLIYQFTFPDDNYSFAYDFNTGSFFNVTDNDGNYHPAKKVAFFNNSYYYVSHNDGSIYELNSRYTTYDGEIVPRIRIPSRYMQPDSSRFKINSVSFNLEQGNSYPGDQDSLPSVDISYSKNGGVSFSNAVRKILNAPGVRQNRFYQASLGYANDFVPQFRFWGSGRFVVGDGVMVVGQ